MNNDYIYNGNIWQYHVYGYVLNYILNNDVTRLRENRSRSDFNEMCNECSNEMTGSLLEDSQATLLRCASQFASASSHFQSEAMAAMVTKPVIVLDWNSLCTCTCDVYIYI